MTSTSHVRRVVLWFASTVVLVVLLFGYRTSTAGAGALIAAGSGNTETPITAAAPADTGAGAGSGSTSGSRSPSTAATAPTPTPTKDAVSTGRSVMTRYGPIQVQVSTQGSTITDVSVLQYPNGDGHSAEISQYALPQLVQHTVDQQSAQVDMVSGATYTSTGYAQSLQSALDQAGV